MSPEDRKNKRKTSPLSVSIQKREDASIKTDEYAYNTPIIRLKNLSKYYRYPFGDVIALKEISFEIDPGEYVSILGPKGSGKSTLINLIGCLDTATGGVQQILNTHLSLLDTRTFDQFRLDHIGVISPQLRLNSLISLRFTLNNKLLLRYRSYLPEGRAEQILTRVGIPSEYWDIPCETLSDEMAIRGSIARALVTYPEIILCDEIFDDLDAPYSSEIIALLESLNIQGITLIVATEHWSLAKRASRQLRLHDGSLMGDRKISRADHEVTEDMPVITDNSSLFSFNDESKKGTWSQFPH